MRIINLVNIDLRDLRFKNTFSTLTKHTHLSSNLIYTHCDCLARYSLTLREELRPVEVLDSPFQVELDIIWAREAQNLDPHVPIIKVNETISIIYTN